MAKIDAETIAENADGPQSVSSDGTTVTQHSLKDQIEADKYRRKSSALSGNPYNKLSRVRVIARGTTD
jgi:hypothetical protein